MKVRDLYMHEIRKTTFKAIHNLLSQDVNIFDSSKPLVSCSTRSVCHGDISLSVRMCKKSLWFRSVAIWNEADLSLKVAKVKLSTFVSKSKSYVLKSYKDFICSSTYCFSCDGLLLTCGIFLFVDLGPHLFQSLLG